MKAFILSILSLSLFQEGTIARLLSFPARNDLLSRGGGKGQGCGFTLTSSGSFACPAGQLPDGQIRLNGTEDTATFYYSNDGIIDSNGFGCIVTRKLMFEVQPLYKRPLADQPAAVPITQIQCDEGATPDTGFSIDASNNLLYHGSPTFYACPASDTEYNVYVDPEFGQTKCFPITLQASGCGAEATTCPSAVPSTVWQTQTITDITTYTVTLTTTSACPSTTGIFTNSTTHCPHCTKTGVVRV